MSIANLPIGDDPIEQLGPDPGAGYVVASTEVGALPRQHVARVAVLAPTTTAQRRPVRTLCGRDLRVVVRPLVRLAARDFHRGERADAWCQLCLGRLQGGPDRVPVVREGGGSS